MSPMPGRPETEKAHPGEAGAGLQVCTEREFFGTGLARC